MQQIDAIFEDIYPDAIKIGMVASSELIRVIADRLRYYDVKNVVVDPVMAAKQIGDSYHCSVLLYSNGEPV